MAVSTKVRPSPPLDLVATPSSSTDRWLARFLGALFITATVALLVSQSVESSLATSPIDLTRIHANETQLALAAAFQLIAAMACGGIAIHLYPVLRKHNVGLALGAVGFRTMEAVMYFIGIAGLLSLVTLSQQYIAVGAPHAALRTLASLIPQARD